MKTSVCNIFFCARNVIVYDGDNNSNGDNCGITLINYLYAFSIFDVFLSWPCTFTLHVPDTLRSLCLSFWSSSLSGIIQFTSASMLDISTHYWYNMLLRLIHYWECIVIHVCISTYGVIEQRVDKWRRDYIIVSSTIVKVHPIAYKTWNLFYIESVTFLLIMWAYAFNASSKNETCCARAKTSYEAVIVMTRLCMNILHLIFYATYKVHIRMIDWHSFVIASLFYCGG